MYFLGTQLLSGRIHSVPCQPFSRGWIYTTQGLHTLLWRSIVLTLRVWPLASKFDPIHFLSKMFLELIFDFTFSQCFLYVRDLSRVTAKYLGNGICSISTPFHVIFNFWLASLLCRWKAQGTTVDRFLIVYPGQRLKRLKIYHRVRRKPEANAKGAQQNSCNPKQPTSLGTWYMIL